MSEQDGTQAPTLQRPENDDKKAWRVYWSTLGQPWRTESEIDVEQQRYLDERRSIKPDFGQGFYPFKDIELSRADIEWLLATHEDGRGPVDWNAESQRIREGLDLRFADFRDEDLHDLPLTKCNLHKALLQKPTLIRAQLQGADLGEAHFEGADLRKAHFEGAKLRDVVLANAHHNGPQLADVHLGDTNLVVVDWNQITKLGDEYMADQKIDKFKRKKDEKARLVEYKTAVRAYRQLSVVLRNQGLNEDAARFTYRAQLMQRKVFWYQRKFLSFLGSLFLDLLSGYGYKPGRCFIAYLLVIFAFATTYFLIGHKVGPVLSPLGSVVFSMTSFHGRGFFPGGIALDDPLTVLAATEAFVGLLIEVTFIATLTQRLFGK